MMRLEYLILAFKLGRKIGLRRAKKVASKKVDKGPWLVDLTKKNRIYKITDVPSKKAANDIPLFDQVQPLFDQAFGRKQSKNIDKAVHDIPWWEIKYTLPKDNGKRRFVTLPTESKLEEMKRWRKEDAELLNDLEAWRRKRSS
jgi:hypothetical protein